MGVPMWVIAIVFSGLSMLAGSAAEALLGVPFFMAGLVRVAWWRRRIGHDDLSVDGRGLAASHRGNGIQVEWSKVDALRLLEMDRFHEWKRGAHGTYIFIDPPATCVHATFGEFMEIYVPAAMVEDMVRRTRPHVLLKRVKQYP